VKAESLEQNALLIEHGDDGVAGGAL